MGDMLEIARQVMEKAYSPYSHFKVGACLKAEDGSLYAGCNIENASYSLTLCAESSALAGLVSAGRKKITEIVLISSSDEVVQACGACRQRFLEFTSPDVSVHMYNQKGDKMTLTMGELLPYSFNSNYLEESHA